MESQNQNGGPIQDIEAIVRDFSERIMPSLEKILRKVASSDMLDNAEKVLQRAANGIWGLLKK